MYKSIKDKPLFVVAIISIFSILSTSLIINQSTAQHHPIICRNVGTSIIWNPIRNFFCEEKVSNSSAGEELCSISPFAFESYYITWSERPLFGWNGKVKSIKIKPYSKESSSWIWSQDIEENEQSFIYNGEGEKALKPGEEYEYVVVYQTNDSQGNIITITSREIIIKVMEEPERQNILNELENRGLEKQGDLKLEEYALERAKFFVEKGLYLDVAREIFSVSLSEASLEYQEEINLIRTQICQ